MDCLSTTNKYYANWLGVSCNVMSQDGICLIKSIQRAVCQRGYPAKFDLYVFIQNERIIISYYDKAENHLTALLNDIEAGDKSEHIFHIIKGAYGIMPNKKIKFVFHHLEHNNTLVKELTINDYPLYLQFFITNLQSILYNIHHLVILSLFNSLINIYLQYLFLRSSFILSDSNILKPILFRCYLLQLQLFRN